MLTPKSILIPVSLVALAGLALVWWLAGSAPTPDPPSDRGEDARAVTSPVLPAISPLVSAFDLMRQMPDRPVALRSLNDLQASLMAMPPDAALACIRAFLESGKDHPTGLSFEIGSAGTLKEWPTFRTFLLDTLLAVNPAAAAEWGRKILTNPTSADEWALALRNVGKVETSEEANAYLRERTTALIANPAWQAKPSVGFLNAFDVLVHTQATASTPMLSSLIQQKDRKDLAHAGFLTLDRLVQRNPVEVLPQLAADLPLQQSRPEMLAQQFARADLRDPAQHDIVKIWLLDPVRTPADLRAFAAIYPNNNRFISNNLLTTESPQSGSDLSKHDRAALEIINSWSADPAFQPVNEHLRAMIARLNGFVQSAQSPPPPSPTR